MPPTSITTIDGTTSDGHRARVVVDITAPDQPTTESATFQRWPGPMAVGTTVQDEEFHLFGTRAKGSAFCRTFSPPGTAILPWSAPNRRLPATVAEFHSWKDWPSDAGAIALINAQLDTMPARLLEEPPLLPHLRPYDPDGYGDGGAESDGFSLLLTWFHEGEKNMIDAGIPAREWRRRHRLAYKTIRQHRNGHRVGYMSIGTLTWLVAKSNPAKGIVKGDGDPFAWWSGVGDFAAIDCYAASVDDVPAAPAHYPTPAVFFELLDQLAAGTGRRPFVPELGVIRQGRPADTGGLRANWITNVVQYADAHDYAGVAWWDAPGANNRDFRLTDAPSAGAWSAEITRDRTPV
jgi:hypothetical protein